jgi:hypothetical protein
VIIDESTADDPRAAGSEGEMERDDLPSVATPSDPAPQSTRERKRKLRQEAKERLARWRFVTGQEIDEPIRLVLEGDHIGRDSGDGEAIGSMILRASKLLRALGATPRVESLEFGKSVIVNFTSDLGKKTKDAHDRGDVAHGQIQPSRHVSAPEHVREPSLAPLDAIESGAVSETLVAAHLASDLLTTSVHQTPQRAVNHGAQVAESYRTLANAVARSEVTLTILAPAHEAAQLTPRKATLVADALRESTQPKEITITAFGTLSIADQEQSGFGLRLDSKAERDPLLKGKRVVHGVYLPEVETKIRDEGLWGRPVKAKLLVVRDALVSTSAIRPASYTLISVEPRH